GSEEIAALMLLALTSAHESEKTVTDRLAHVLLARRAAEGLWATTFASAVACRALAQYDAQTANTAPTTIAGRFNAESFGPLQSGSAFAVRPVSKSFVAQQVNALDLVAQGMVSVEITQHMWFPDIASFPAASQAFDLRVSAGSQTLRQGETTTLKFSVKRNAWQPPAGFAFNEWWPGADFTPPTPGVWGDPVIVVLGIPDTMRVFSDTLDAWQNAGWIARYELTGREIRLYFNGLTTDGFHAELPLFAQNPGTVTAPASTVREYYNPDGVGISPPLTFTVSR
ncbi:MAG: hypothetical protein AB7S36_17005, partial [Planctomycetota bacterium]